MCAQKVTGLSLPQIARRQDIRAIRRKSRQTVKLAVISACVRHLVMLLLAYIFAETESDGPGRLMNSGGPIADGARRSRSTRNPSSKTCQMSSHAISTKDIDGLSTWAPVT